MNDGISREGLRISELGNIGIGSVDPKNKLTVNGGGFQLQSGDTLPLCNKENRGLQWYLTGGASKADRIMICGKDRYDKYYWVLVKEIQKSNSIDPIPN